MVLLPSIASFNIADLFTKPIPRHRYTQLFIGIGVDPTTLTTSVVSPTVDSSATTPTLVASTATLAPVDPTSNLVPHPVPCFVDAGASLPVAPSRSDFALEVSQAPCGLIRSPTSVIQSNSKPASTVDPHTLITGEDTAISVDLSSPDTIDFVSDSGPSDSGPSFTKVTFDIRQFGTASLTFIYSKSTSELLHIFVDPTQIDWLHWVPLPRLILPESYFHIFGLDYLQAFTLFHLIPIWIYFLLHFAVNLD